MIRVPIHLDSNEQEEFDRCSRQVRAYLAERRRDEPGFEWTDLTRRSRTDVQAREVLRAYRRKLTLIHRSAEKLRVVEDILRLHPDEQCVIFTASTRMALDVSARFLIPALTAHSDKRECNAVLDGFARGTIRALAACEVLNEEWDAPALKLRGRGPGDAGRGPGAPAGTQRCLPGSNASITGTGEPARSFLTAWPRRICPTWSGPSASTGP